MMRALLLAALILPVFSGVATTDPALRPQVEKLAIQVQALKQIVRNRLAPALDLAVGFNSLDGD